MVFAECGTCPQHIVMWDAVDAGWAHPTTVRAKWTCPDCLKKPSAHNFIKVGEVEKVLSRKVELKVVPNPFQPPVATPEHFGFTQPEDGSEERYETRKLKVPWKQHTFWWVVHNNVAHPLIGLLPFRPFFEFHDYTSRKLHGK